MTATACTLDRLLHKTQINTKFYDLKTLELEDKLGLNHFVSMCNSTDLYFLRR